MAKAKVSKKAVNQVSKHQLRVAHIIMLVLGFMITWSGFDSIRTVVDSGIKYSPDWQVPAYMVLFGGAIIGVAINGLATLKKNDGKK